MRSGKASGCTAWSGRMIEMGIFRKYVSQTRKPEGIPGKMMIKGMNFGHVKMEDWGMDHLKTISPKEIIDIGCGGGRNAGELLKRYPGAKVTAVDYSSLSVEQAAEYNKNAVAAGRCVVKQGDVSELELDEGRYGLATAFETIYSSFLAVNSPIALFPLFHADLDEKYHVVFKIELRYVAFIHVALLLSYSNVPSKEKVASIFPFFDFIVYSC